MLEEQLRLLRIEKYGAGGEKLSQAQMQLFELEPVVSEMTEQPESEHEPAHRSTKKPAKHPGRQELPANLPRIERILPCTADQRLCKRCGKETVVIGYEESSQLDVEPAKYFVLVTKREKFAHRQRTSGTEGCSDSLGRGKLPSAASPGARLLLHDSPWACRSPDPVPSRLYSRCVGRPAFIGSSDRGIGMMGFLRLQPDRGH